MLPFLKPKSQGGTTAVTYRKPDSEPEQKQEENQGLKEAMQELSNAISAGDSTRAAAAFKAAFTICESEPHYEESSEPSEDTE